MMGWLGGPWDWIKAAAVTAVAFLTLGGIEWALRRRATNRCAASPIRPPARQLDDPDPGVVRFAETCQRHNIDVQRLQEFDANFRHHLRRVSDLCAAARQREQLCAEARETTKLIRETALALQDLLERRTQDEQPFDQHVRKVTLGGLDALTEATDSVISLLDAGQDDE